LAVLSSTLKLSLLDHVSANARRITGVLNGLQRQQTQMMAPFRGGLGQIMALGAGYIGATEGIDSTAGAAMRFESAFADVRKVVDATDQQFAEMQKNIRSLATTLPTTATDLAALYAAGGESGIATADLNEFALMAARVGIAFDLSAGEAGESLAKLKTQLGLSIGETGELAAALTHLSTNLAPKPSDIADFMLRVGAFTKIGGLAKEQTAALGSAMFAAGADPSTAATAMQNVVKAMTRGASAKKSQKAVAKALGLNLPQLAKDMQKDAPAAIKKVLAAIGKAPKDQHVALLSDFFGDEAKAFAPLIGDLGLLDDALQSVGDRTKYAGSAFREYVERAKTTENVLSILRNKFSEVGMQLGDRMLPSIREAALGLGNVLDTLSERKTVFEDLNWAAQGFLQGLGMKGGIKESIEELGDLLLGPAEGPTKKQDHIAAVFARFREYGANLRELNDAIRSSPVASFITDLGLAVGGMGFSKWFRIYAIATGIKAVVDAARGASSIKEFTENLKGLSALEWAGVGAGLLMIAGRAKAAVGWFKELKDVTPKVTPATPGGATAGGATTSGTPSGAVPSGAFNLKNFAGGLLKGGAAAALGYFGEMGINKVFDSIYGADKAVRPPDLATSFDNFFAAWQKTIADMKANAGPRGETYQPFQNLQEQRVGFDLNALRDAVRPTGTQDVNVTNPIRPNVTVSVSMSNSFASGDAAAAASMGKQIGAAVKAEVEASLGGGGGW